MRPNQYDGLWVNQGWLKCDRCGAVERPMSDGGTFYEGRTCDRTFRQPDPTAVINGHCYRLVEERCDGEYHAFDSEKVPC